LVTGVQTCALPILSDDPRFQTAGDRYDHADEVDAALRPWLMAHTAREVADILQGHRVPASPVVGFEEVLDDAHLRARRFLEPIDIGGRTLTMPGRTVVVGDAPRWTPAPPLAPRSHPSVNPAAGPTAAGSVPPM